MPKNATMPSDNAVTPTVKLRLANRCSSTIGCLSVSSHATKNTSATRAVMPSARIIGEENQSLSLPLSSMNCRQPTPSTSRTRPTLSIGVRTILDSRLRSRFQVTTAASSPTGTLM